MPGSYAFVKKGLGTVQNFIMQHLLQFRKLKNKIQSPRNSQTLQRQNPSSVPPNTYFNTLPKKKKELIFLINVLQRKNSFTASVPNGKKLPFFLLCTHASKQATVSSTCILKIQHLFSTVFLSTFYVCAKPATPWRTETDSAQMYMDTQAPGQIPLNVFQGLIPTPNKYHRILLNIRFLELSSL